MVPYLYNLVSYAFSIKESTAENTHFIKDNNRKFSGAAIFEAKTIR